MGIKKALWVSFAIMVAHNSEEYLTMGKFLKAHREQLPNFLNSMTANQFVISLFIITLLMFLIIWFATHSRLNGPWLVLGIALQAGMVVNGLQHGAIAVWAGSYAPGSATGVLLSLPYGIYLVRRAVREKWVPVRALTLTSLAVIVISTPLLFAVHALAMLIL